MAGRHMAFTLVELLVVMAIIGGMMALLLPAVQAARETSRRNRCADNLRQIGLALANYHVALASFPPGNIHRTAGNCPGMEEPATSYSTNFGNWLIAILPYIEQTSLYEGYDLRYKNESSENRAVRETPIAVYVCSSDYASDVLAIPARGPAAKVKAQYMPGSYRAMSGRSDDSENYLDSEMMYAYNKKSRGAIHLAGVWGYGSETLAHIHDGTSNTLMVGESSTRTSPGFRTFWAYSFAYFTLSGATAQSRTLWGDYDRCVAEGGTGGSTPCKRAWGGLHPGGVNFILCDGSHRFIATDIDMPLFGNLATIAGSETVLSQ